MNIDGIKQKINDLDSNIIKDFILDLYLQYPELENKIETLLLYNEPAALNKAILKRIQSVSRGRKYIDYRMSFSFARDLDFILSDIESGLLKSSPKHALDLLSKFLATSNKVYERIDDSSGDVGAIYQNAVLLWLTAASQWKTTSAAGAKLNWLERVYDLYSDNDYAVYDVLLPNCNILLDHDQLVELAWRYESELRQSLKSANKNDTFNLASLTSRVALGLVAEALKDPALYERATLISSPEPNDLQKEAMIKMYLKFNQVDGAMRWLNTSWSTRFEGDRLRLLDEAHLQSGNVDELKKTRYQTYLRDKSYSSFKRYFELLKDKEQQTARDEAIKLAEQGGGQLDDIAVNVDLLLQLNEPERAQLLVLAKPEKIAAVFYDSLLKLAKNFETQKCWLAATVCYRGLLLDILNQGRSKAYTHAARYYKKLAMIAEKLPQYKPLDDHAKFIKQLEEAHGRKRSFWQRVL